MSLPHGRFRLRQSRLTIAFVEPYDDAAFRDSFAAIDAGLNDPSVGLRIDLDDPGRRGLAVDRNRSLDLLGNLIADPDAELFGFRCPVRRIVGEWFRFVRLRACGQP